MSQLLDSPSTDSGLQSTRSESITEPTLYLWTVSQYQQIVALGLLDPDVRYELLQGEIVPKGSSDPTSEDVAWGARWGTVYRWTPEQYDRLAQANLLTPDAHTEMVEGVIFQKMTINPPHAQVLTLLNRKLNRSLSDEWLVRPQNPLATLDGRPEPDIAIVREADYSARHPTGRETPLVIEIAESSLAFDREKAASYAAAGVLEYWIINLPERQIERYTAPNSSSRLYEQSEFLRDGESICLTIEGEKLAEWTIESILPPRQA